MEEYQTVHEGKYKGISYLISRAEIVKKDGTAYMEFDYDVKGLNEKSPEEFEKYLGDILNNALSEAIKRDDEC